jgi:hypothetical protein
LRDEVSRLNGKSADDDSALTALLAELQETQEKLNEAYKDMDGVGDDAYRDCVKTLKFLNPEITLNIRGLDKYHGVKDGRFWDFHDYHNPMPLDPHGS